MAQGDFGSQSGFEHAGERSRQHMWSIVVTLMAKGMELEGRCIKVSPKLDRRGVQKKVQCTREMMAAEALLPGAELKIDFEYCKVCCKVASGKQLLVAEITHDYKKFVWRIGMGLDLTQEHIDKTVQRLDNEHRAARDSRLQPPRNHSCDLERLRFSRRQHCSAPGMDVAGAELVFRGDPRIPSRRKRLQKCVVQI